MRHARRADPRRPADRRRPAGVEPGRRASSKDTWVLASEPEKSGGLLAAGRGPGSRRVDPAGVHAVPGRREPVLAGSLRRAGRGHRAAAAGRRSTAATTSSGGAEPGRHRVPRTVLLAALTHLTTTYPGFVGDRRRRAAGRPRAPSCSPSSSTTGRPGTPGLLAAARCWTPPTPCATSCRATPGWCSAPSSRDLEPLRDLGADCSRGLQAVARPASCAACWPWPGSATESMVRDPGWRFMDAGRRIERALQLASLLRATARRRSATPRPTACMLESVLIRPRASSPTAAATGPRPSSRPCSTSCCSTPTTPARCAYQLDRLDRGRRRAPPTAARRPQRRGAARRSSRPPGCASPTPPASPTALADDDPDRRRARDLPRPRCQTAARATGRRDRRQPTSPTSTPAGPGGRPARLAGRHAGGAACREVPGHPPHRVPLRRPRCPRATARPTCCPAAWPPACLASELVIEPAARATTASATTSSATGRSFSIHEPHRELTVTATSVVDVTTAPPAAAHGSEPWESAATVSTPTRDPDSDRGPPVRARLAARSPRPRRSRLRPARRSRRAGRWSRPSSTCRTASTPTSPTGPAPHDHHPPRRGARPPAGRVPGLRPPGHRLPASHRPGRPLRQRLPRDRAAARARPSWSGADASHAWVSVFVPGAGWIDLDPTNDQVARRPLHHHRLGPRLRRRHAPQGRGVLGRAEHKLTVSVDVNRQLA